MFKSSSKILRVVCDWDDFFSVYYYTVFYSSGFVRKYGLLNVPSTVNSAISNASCLYWRDGKSLVFDIMEVTLLG